MELDAAALKARLARAASGATLYGDDDSGREAAAVTAAAVLVPVITHAHGLTVLFTRRTVHLKAHSGQVSFPGGRAEPNDATPEATALREAEEEIGLAPSRVEVIGRLPEYLTRTGFRVTPVIGLIEPPLELLPDAREVDEVFEVPLAFLMDPQNHQRATRELAGRTVGYYVIEHEGRTIWGATAGMLVNLYRTIVG
ncbi:MAG: CoA pyrophosphatase [Burkholderiales bacterium]